MPNKERNQPSRCGYTQINKDNLNRIRVEKLNNEVKIQVGHPTDPFESGTICLNANEAALIKTSIEQIIKEIQPCQMKKT